MQGDQKVAVHFPMISNLNYPPAAMKKRQRRLDISLHLQVSSEHKSPADDENILNTECRIVIRQDKTGAYNIHADLVLADTPLAKQVIRQLEWLDWPL